ncbi:MAG: RlmE family RNA methyltransferase [Hyphomicrobiaceae bacterium]|nr:RlmE family RNA methyltransferase [Hyphomicrobiaceae bacterium]
MKNTTKGPSKGPSKPHTARPKTAKPKAPKAKGSGMVAGQVGSAQRQLKVRVKHAHKRSVSSNRWLERHINDPYVAASKRDGFRSRAAYKLIEIDDKYRVLKRGHRVIDLGAAPGGWAQIAAERVGAAESGSNAGQVVAIDYLQFDPIPGVVIYELDFLDPTAPEKLKSHLRDGRADVVLSDMAAPTTGHTRTDHIRIMGLAEAAIEFACEVLEPGGAFISKVFQGGTEGELLNLLKQHFAVVRHVKPPASRAESAELYVIATGFRVTKR